MNLLKSFVAALVLVTSLVTLSPAASVLAAGGSNDQACAAIQAVNPSATCDSKQKSQSAITKILRTVLNLISLIAGVIAVIMLIIGGLKYITSQGEAAATAGAKNTIIYAVIGLVIVAFAQLIVKFVLAKAT